MKAMLFLCFCRPNQPRFSQFHVIVWKLSNLRKAKGNYYRVSREDEPCYCRGACRVSISISGCPYTMECITANKAEAEALRACVPEDSTRPTRPTQSWTRNKFRLKFLPSQLSGRSLYFLSQVSGFLDSKRVLDSTAEAVLPHKWMELHPSFVDKELMVQKNLRGERVKTLDELLEVAKLAKPAFDSIMNKIVCNSGLDPAMRVTTKDGKPVMLDHTNAFKVLSLAPLKGGARMVEKATKELEGDFSRIVDVVRCSVVAFTEEQLECVAQALKYLEQEDKKAPQRDDRDSQGTNEYVVVRLKNRFKSPLFNGYRDALYNLVVNCGDGVTHVCEVQLHLADIVAHKERSHVFYEYFRAYFNGSGAEESRMRALQCMEGFEAHVDDVIDATLQGSDLEQLDNLAYLFEELMGDARVGVLIHKRRLELDDSLTCQRAYASALASTGKLSEAKSVFQKVLAQRRQQLGDSHLDTLNSIHDLASVLNNQGKLTLAEPLFREELEGRKQQLGSSHPDTLTAIRGLAIMLRNQGKLNEAEPLFWQVLDQRRQLLGNSHPDTLLSINDAASLLRNQGKLTEAEPLYREALEKGRQQLGALHPQTFNSMDGLAMLLLAQGKPAEAEPLLGDAVLGRWELLGGKHPDSQKSFSHLSSFLIIQGRSGEMRDWIKVLCSIQR